MADIRPFRGIRYNLEKLGQDAFADVVAPPYDVIDEAEQKALYERHPHNFVRIDLNIGRDEDDAQNDRYTRARRHLMDWLAQGVFAFEDEPAVYVHHQSFTDESGTRITRRGFLATIRLAEYEENVVLPHERTLRGPKIDRLNLMKATECNLSPVFFLYDDPESVIDRALADAVQNEQAARVVTEDGIEHVLWRVRDEQVHALVAEQLRDESVLIADGHHRYETALAYRDFRREVDEDPQPDAPYEFALGFFVNFRDPGLAVYPTHRVVYGVEDFDFDAFIEKLGAHQEFEVSRIAGGRSTELLRKALEDGGKQAPSFVLMCKGCVPALVKFRGTPTSPIFDEETPREVRQLDVAILHEGLFDRMLGISKEAQEAKTNLRYVKGFDAAMEEVEREDTQLVVLMNATPVEQVDEVCRSGGKMPQKSTFFYPKILSGLVINPL